MDKDEIESIRQDVQTTHSRKGSQYKGGGGGGGGADNNASLPTLSTLAQSQSYSDIMQETSREERAGRGVGATVSTQELTNGKKEEEPFFVRKSSYQTGKVVMVLSNNEIANKNRMSAAMYNVILHHVR